MRVFGKRWVAALSLLLVTALVAACSGNGNNKSDTGSNAGSSGTAAAPAGGGTLKYGLSADLTRLDPAMYDGTAALAVKINMYDGLVAYGLDGKITGILAGSWETPDPKTYVFHLRKGVKFHNGDDFTADDVAFTISRIQDPKVGASRGADLKDIEKVETPDPYTVKFDLKQPNYALLSVLARPESAIVDKKWVQGGGDLKTAENGTGPFKLEKREVGTDIKLVKNPNYFMKDQPKLDGIDFIISADEDARVAALQSGDVQMIDYVPWKDMQAIEANPKLALAGDSGAYLGLLFNTKVKPFDDVRVRQAVAYAVNRDNILKGVFFGKGRIMTGGSIPDTFWAFNKDLEGTYSYNPDKAKQLLAEAGYPNGLDVTLLSTSTYGFHQQTAELVQADLAKVGIRVKLDLQEWGVTTQRWQKGDYQFRVHALVFDQDDPNLLTNWFYTGSSVSKTDGYSNKDVDKLLDQGKATADQNQRKQIYHQVDQQILKDVPYTFLVARLDSEAINKQVKGYTHLPGGLGLMSGYSLRFVTLGKE